MSHTYTYYHILHGFVWHLQADLKEKDPFEEKPCCEYNYDSLFSSSEHHLEDITNVQMQADR